MRGFFICYLLAAIGRLATASTIVMEGALTDKNTVTN